MGNLDRDGEGVGDIGQGRRVRDGLGLTVWLSARLVEHDA